MRAMDGKEFTDLADCDISSIQSFLGAEVTHCTWGLGKIIRIDERRDDGPIFRVRFDSSTKEFNVDSFREGFITKIEMTAEVPAELHSSGVLDSYEEDDLDESERRNIF